MIWQKKTVIGCLIDGQQGTAPDLDLLKGPDMFQRSGSEGNLPGDCEAL